MISNILLDAGVVNRSQFYREETRLRLNRYAELWNMYLGSHWSQDMQDNGDNLVTVNYCAAFVEKAAAFLMAPQGNNKLGVRFLPPDAIPKDEPTKPDAKPTDPAAPMDSAPKVMKSENETLIVPFVDSVWEQNNKQATLMEMGMLGGITGDVFVKVGWREPDIKTPTETVEKVKAQNEDEDEWGNKLVLEPGARKGQIVLSVLDPSLCFPTFDEHDRDNLISCQLMYFITDPNNPWGDPVVYREEYTREYIEIQLGERAPQRQPNALKEIPIVHIKNYPIPGRKYGKSDMHDIIQLQLLLNEKTTDISDIISYHAAPVTVIQGAKVSQLEKGAAKVWSGLPKDAKVANLEMDSDLAGSREFAKGIKESMHELTGVPVDSLGKEQAISNTSGVALSIMYQPLLDRRNIKMASYGVGIQRINRLIIKLGEIMKQLKISKDTKDKYKTLLDFGDPLPKDELIALQVLAQEIAIGLKSRLTAMKERGVKDPEAELARWMHENGAIAKQTADLAIQQDAHKAAAQAALKPTPAPVGGGASGGGKSNNPKGTADSSVTAAAKAALKTNLSGQDVSTYRPGDVGNRA